MSKVALLAGVGNLPVEYARKMRELGTPVATIALVPGVSEDLKLISDSYQEVAIGKLGKILDELKKTDATDVVMLGKINKDKDVVVNGETVLRADKIILAGGSKVGKINIPGIESNKVLTSDDILDLQQIPKSLTVIGGGVVGIELGQVFLSFGSEVTVVEMMDRIVPGVDRESSAVLRKELERKGMKILTSTQIKEIVDDGHTLTVKLEGHDDIVSEKALLSIGRVPDLEAVGELELKWKKVKLKLTNIWKQAYLEFMHREI